MMPRSINLPAVFVSGLLLCFPAVCTAQEHQSLPQSPGSVPTNTPLPVPLKLHFSDPVTFPFGSKKSVIFSDFKCDSDGSIYLPIAEDVSMLSPDGSGGNPASPMIVALTPSGSVVPFAPQGMYGFRNIVSLLRYFVSNSHVYVLEMGDKIDPSDGRKVIGRFHLLQVFDHKGEPTKTIILEPGLDPINLAAFDSGEILIFSLDRLNHTTRLLLLDDSGRRESELSLFDSDLSTKLDLAAKSQNGFYASEDIDALSRLLGLASLIPREDNVMLTASKVNLPELELNQHGVVRTISLALPAGTTIESLLPSDDGLLHAVVGTFRPMVPSDTAGTPKGSFGESAIFSPTEIDVFYPQDGSLVRRISLEAEEAPQPTCAMNGSYTFLAPREEDGKLQLIRATPISQ